MQAVQCHLRFDEAQGTRYLVPPSHAVSAIHHLLCLATCLAAPLPRVWQLVL